MNNCIIIVDFGSQYTLLLAKAIRKCHVFSEIVPCSINATEVKKINPKGIIFSGSPFSCYEKDAPHIDPEIMKLGIPILGVCYGMQEIVSFFGGKVVPNMGNIREYGGTDIFILKTHELFRNIPSNTSMWMSHGDSVVEESIPDFFDILAYSKKHVAAIADDEKKIYACQFHPEVTHSEKGLRFIENFVVNICECDQDWNMKNYIDECMEYVRKTVGKNDVLCFVSGGVDSVFVSALLAKTEGIGRVYPVYINALMRLNETKEIESMLKKCGIPIIIYDAEDEFIEALFGVDEPESKRKIIGNLFGKIMGRVINDLGLDQKNTFLAQGTLYTDIIESGKGIGENAETIKSHHNVGCDFIEKLKKSNKIVEPNRLIFKDEVREAAKEIGLPEETYNREPFPGPGLGIRIINHINNYSENEMDDIDKNIMSIALKQGYEAFVIPIKTVGVQGDKRSYSYLAVIKGERNTEKIFRLSKEITSRESRINRVVYLISRKDIDTRKIVDTFIDKETIEQLKKIDFSGRNLIKKYGYSKNISQTIFTLFGCDLSNENKRSVALRAVVTSDFMTVVPIKFGTDELSWKCLDEIEEKLVKNHNVGCFVVDVSEKPPATTCWE